MALLHKTVDFGRYRSGLTGSNGVRYDIIDASGNLVVQTPSSIYEIMTGSGMYAASVDFPANFRGQIVWTCPSVTASWGSLPVTYATEQFNIEENDPRLADVWQMVNDITGSVQGLYDVAFGRWKIDVNTNRMVFYRDDNTTVVATFDLLDSSGAPTFDGVFERRLVGTVTP